MDQLSAEPDESRQHVVEVRHAADGLVRTVLVLVAIVLGLAAAWLALGLIGLWAEVVEASSSGF